MLNVRTGWSEIDWAIAVISDESIPPERKEPSGTSLCIRNRTESVNSSRNRSQASTLLIGFSMVGSKSQ